MRERERPVPCVIQGTWIGRGRWREEEGGIRSPLRYLPSGQFQYTRRILGLYRVGFP